MSIYNIYPPVMETFIPATPKTNGKWIMNIPFSFSSYSSPSDYLKYIQVIVKTQDGNQSQLNDSKYPLGIKICTYSSVNSNYYITLSSDDFKSFTPNKYYKVQLRLCSSAAETPSLTTFAKQRTWLVQNTTYFSTWSSGSLIKPITDLDMTLNSPKVISGNLIDYMTSMKFSVSIDSSEPSTYSYSEIGERLKSYSAKLYKGSTLIDTIDEVAMDAASNIKTFSNSFSNVYLLPETNYTISISIKTNNLYEKTFTFQLKTAADSYSGKTPGLLLVQPENELGCMKIGLYCGIQDARLENFYDLVGTYHIWRKSAEDGIWKEIAKIDNSAAEIEQKIIDIDSLEYNNNLISALEGYSLQKEDYSVSAIEDDDISVMQNKLYSSEDALKVHNDKIIDDDNQNEISDKFYCVLGKDYYDYTVENGVPYQYEIQKEVPLDGGRTAYCIISDTAHGNASITDNNLSGYLSVNFDSVFLCDEDYYLKIPFDCKINSYDRKISESKVETLGSKYPFVRRNTLIDYHELVITGKIYSGMDETQSFLTNEELYGTSDYYNYYDTIYNVNKRVNPDLDEIKEKLFREKVIDFLCSTKPKLLRTPHEGNFLVYITDRKFSPVTDLSGRLYDFSITATEMDEPTVESYKEYNILSEDSSKTRILNVDKTNINIMDYDSIGNGTTVTEKETYQYIYQTEIIGQLQGIINADINLVLNDIRDKYLNRTFKAGSGIIYNKLDNICLTKLKINLISPPQKIKYESGNFIYTDDTEDVFLGYILNEKESDSDSIKQIIISKDGIYEQTKEINIEYLSFEDTGSDLIGTIDYVAALTLSPYEKVSDTIENTREVVGQLFKSFDFSLTEFLEDGLPHFTDDSDLIINLKEKYFLEGPNYLWTIAELHGLQIQAPPGVCCHIYSYGDADYAVETNDWKEFVINDTGFLSIIDGNEKGSNINSLITGLHFTGYKLKEWESGQFLSNEYYPADDITTVYEYGEIINDNTNNLINRKIYNICFPEDLYQIYAKNTSQNLLKIYNENKSDSISNNSITGEIVSELDENNISRNTLIISKNSLTSDEKKLIVTIPVVTKEMIWFNGNLYPIMRKTNDNKICYVVTPVDAIVDYYCTVAKLKVRSNSNEI